MTLVELIVAGIIGLVAIVLAGEMFAIMGKAMIATQSKAEAEITARQSLDDVLRLMRSGTALASCERWSVADPIAPEQKLDQAHMGKCMKFNSAGGSSAAEATSTSLTLYAYTDATGDTAGKAPDMVKFQLAQDNTRTPPTATLTVKVFKAGSSDSMVKARCVSAAGTTAGSTGDCSAMAAGTTMWTTESSATTITVAPDLSGAVNATPKFTYLNDAGQVQSTPSPTTARVVIVDLGVRYRAADNTDAIYAFRADVALRARSYGEQELGK